MHLTIDVSVQDCIENAIMLNRTIRCCKLPKNEKEGIERYDWCKHLVIVNTVLLNVTL